MVKLNIYSSSSSPPAATTPPYSSANRNQRGGGSSTKFGGKPQRSGGGSASKFGGKPKPWTPTARPSLRKAQENGENFGGKMRAQSEPRKHFQQRHQQSPFTKPILKMPNSAKPAVVDHQRTPFKFGQKRRVSFGSESNGSVGKQRKMLRVEKSGDETPKIGGQILHQKMNGGSATSKGAGNRTPKAFDHQRVPSAQRQPTIANVVENATTTTTPVVSKAKQYQQDTGKAVQKQRENDKKGQQQQQPEKDKAVQQREKKKGQQPEKGKTVQQQENGKKVQQQQQPEKGKTVQQREKGKKVQRRQQNNTAIVTATMTLIKDEAKSQTQQKDSKSDQKGAVPVSKREKKRLQKKNRKAKIQQQKGQSKHETLQKNEKNNYEKLTRQAVETLQNAVNMMQNGDVKEEAEKEGGGKNDDALFNTVASALERLIPARFSFGHVRSFRFSVEHSNAIVRMGAVLEPKKFKQCVQLTSVSKEGSKTAEEKEEDEPRVLAHTLWVLSASLCLLGHAASAAGGEKNVRRHDEYLKEAVELRKMARDLLSSATDDAAADVQQKQQPFVTSVAAMAPALVDLVLAWASRTAWIHRALGAFALSRFAKWLHCAHLEPILEAIVQKDAELLQAEGESDEEEEDEEEMEGEDKSEDEAEENEEEEKAEVNPKLVADVRKAMGKAAFPKNVAEVPSDEDNWELSDDQMFRLDHDLARAFRKHSSQRAELARQASIFRMRLIDLLFAYLSVAPYSEAMSLSMHILSSVVWRTNTNQKKLGIQVIEPLLRRKKENTASLKRLAKLFKQLIDGAASTEQTEQQQIGKREAAEAVARGSLLLFSLASDHEEHKCAPELLQLVEQKLLNAYFTDGGNTNRTLLQSTVLERLCRQYPQYLGSKFLLAILDFTIDNKVPENKKLQAFNFAHSLLSRKDSPKYYATVLDDIGTYFARAVPLFIKQSAPTDDIKKTKRLLAKFVFMLGWFLNDKIASEASTNAIKQSVARAAIDGPLDEQKLTALLGQDGMKELRRFLMLRGAIQQFGGDKMVAVRFIAALSKKLEVVEEDVKTADEEEEDEDESEVDDEEEEEEADDGEETDDEMEDEEEEEMEDEDEDDDVE